MPDDLADSYRMTAKLPFPSEILGNKYVIDFFVMKRGKIYLNSFQVWHPEALQMPINLHCIDLDIVISSFTDVSAALENRFF